MLPWQPSFGQIRQKSHKNYHNFTCVRHINAVLFRNKVSAISEFICENTLLKGQTGVTMASNFGTKIAISALHIYERRLIANV